MLFLNKHLQECECVKLHLPVPHLPTSLPAAGPTRPAEAWRRQLDHHRPKPVGHAREQHCRVPAQHHGPR
jgi:hypothetical protein